MKYFLLSCLWWLGSSTVQAQATRPSSPYSQANYIMGLNLSQWTVGQYQLEVERLIPGRPITWLAQVFGGYLDTAFIDYIGGRRPNRMFNSSSHWGLGVGMRFYERLERNRLFIHLGIHYRELTVRYDQKQWVNQLVDGVPVIRYLDQEVADRWVGPGGEVLFGAQMLIGKWVLEPALGLVFRHSVTVGTFHGRQWTGRNQFYLNTDVFNPMAQLKVCWFL